MESCVIELTEAAQKHGNLNLSRCGRDFFPKDVFGGPTKTDPGKPITIVAAGLTRPVQTDIPSDSQTGKPRWMFRRRAWIRDFVRMHNLMPGETVLIERLDHRKYRLSLPQRTSQCFPRTFLEFFAGIGLVRMGLEQRGWRAVYANDIDPDKKVMYDAHFSGAQGHFDLGDIHEVDGSGLPRATLATASFPCTDLSLAGSRKGLNGGQSSSYFGFIKVLEGMGANRPALVLLENVTAFLSSHGGRDFHLAMFELNKLGYSVDPFVLDAKWFVPQSRPRLFVVASRLPPQSDKFNPGLMSPSRIRPPMLTEFITAHSDLRWSLRKLPAPPRGSSLSLRDVLDDLDNNAPEWWAKDRAEYLYSQMSPRHRAIADEWIGKRRWSYGTVFRRVRRQLDGRKHSMAELRSDGLAGCLRTPKGGSGRQILFKAGFGRYAVRLLTPRECARLMGAGNFTIKAKLNQALFGFGDAVCVPAISWIAENYLEPLVLNIGDSSW